ncbi:MAG: type-F conjugative transfer system pilin assembly protein TrbC [Gammaproteobacteria bacterium]|nr:type-F conjugative transfer system pilin assembly protein TrbC [Gammaproteobacteria bacterium]
MCSKIFTLLLTLCLVHPVFAKDLACEAECFGAKASKDLEATSKTIPPSKKPYELMIFVSLGMPKQSLRLWAEQAAHLNIPLRIRGFYKNSLQKTTEKSFELFGKNNSEGLLIDPESFENYNLQTVPAVVLVLAPREMPEKIPPLFEVVYGDTSLDAALTLITRQGCLEARTIATSLLNQYRAKAHHD